MTNFCVEFFVGTTPYHINITANSVHGQLYYRGRGCALPPKVEAFGALS